MRVVTQLFYLLPCKAGTKVVLPRTDLTSESPFRLGSFQLLMEAKAVSKCLPRVPQWFSSFEGSHCAVACVCLLGAGEKVKGTSDSQLIFLPWVQRVEHRLSHLCYPCLWGSQLSPSSGFMWVPVASPTSLTKASPHCVVGPFFPATLQRLHISG